MTTQKIRLRHFTPTDQEQILDILTSDKVNKTYMLPDYENRDDAIPLFQKLMALSKNSQRFIRCVDLNGSAVGVLNDVEIKNGSIELGYAVHPEHHNHGYMTEALTTAIRQLFASGYTCVICGAFEENKASQRVMEKCSMRRMKKVDAIEYRGKIHQCVYYQITNREEN